MRTSLNPLMYKDWSFSKLYTEPGTYTLNLSAGTYQYIMRGAGGAGGNNDSSNNIKGGAGGKGELSVGTFTIEENTLATIYVGEMGVTYANGGNGGARGDGTDAPVNPGAGGGGGKPSYISVDGANYVANGGGGGGGAGGSDTNRARYSDGGSGGGGGGYYSLSVSQSTTRAISFYYVITDDWYLTEDSSGVSMGITIPVGLSGINVGETFHGTAGGVWNTTVTVTAINGTDVTFSGALEQTGDWPYQALQPLTVVGLLSEPSVGLYNISGKKGGKGSVYTQNGSHSAAQNGVTGNTTGFPEISSGMGGNGNNADASWRAGGSAASGGGASGAGGGCGTGNDTSSRGGGGGGGAGGSTDAGGGQGGTGYRSGSNGSNHHTTPTDTTEENANYGFPGNYGMGGGPNTNGNSGFVFVRLLP